MNTEAAGTEEISNSSENGYRRWKTEVTNIPEVKRMSEVTHLVMLLPGLIELNVRILNTDSIQNSLIKEYLELMKLNIELLMRYEPSDFLQSALEEVDLFLKELPPVDQANTLHDLLQNLEHIYDLLEKLKKAKANVEQVDFVQELREVQRFILDPQHQFEFELYQVWSNMQSDNLKLDLIKNIVELVRGGFNPTASKSSPYLTQRNLVLMKNHLSNSIIQFAQSKSSMKDTDLNSKIDKLAELISAIGVMSLEQWDNTNWQKINSDAAMSILNSFPEQERYIFTNDSFSNIWVLADAIKKQTHQGGKRVHKNYTWCGLFYEAILDEEWEEIEKFLKQYPVALTTKITVDGYTALHVALKERKETIAMKLLAKLEEISNDHMILEEQDIQGKTALYIAALGDFQDIAKKLVAMNKKTLTIPCDDTAYPLPLFVAVKYGNKQMAKYLYTEMKEMKEMRKDIEEKTINSSWKERAGEWASLLGELIYNDDYDLASLIIHDCPRLALITTDKYGKKKTRTLLFELAQRPLDMYLHCQKIKWVITAVTKKKFHPDTPSKASKLLEQIISIIKNLESPEPPLKDALFKAAEVGNSDFVTKIIDHLPQAVSWLNDQYQNIFHIAVIHRQEKVFNLIYKFDPTRNELSGLSDKSNNNMLHLAAELASQDKRNKVPGAALQLQRELQWFQVVQKMVPNIYTKNQNLKNQTPEEILLDPNHEKLRQEGEIWIKTTAQSCSVVATLITTIIFTTAFTIPGGSDQTTGRPVLLRSTPFIIFIIFDVAALYFSCTSALKFLAILTSSCAQEDFLSSLPNMLISGLRNLFFSMAAMMLSFGVAIYINTYNQYIWLAIAVIVACVIPIFTFARTMFPLFKELLRTKFLPTVGKRKEKLGSCMSCTIAKLFMQ